MKYAIVIYIFCLSILVQVCQLHAYTSGDTIVPVFTSNPIDLTVSCENDIQTLFTDWFNSGANAEADFGEALIKTVLDLNQALTELNQSLTECSNTGLVSIGFFAEDTCGLVSMDTLFAEFHISDFIRPEIVSIGRSISMLCTEFTNDSLVNWVQNAAYAIALDNCDPNPQWLSYVWTDSNGETGFGNIGEEINIPISRQTCFWSVNLSFFIQDECGNINSNTAMFTIESDNESPQIVNIPPDTTILCHQNLDTLAPLILDACDGLIDLEFTESNTRSIDSLSCSYFEYSILRTWFGADACGNTVNYSQNVQVVDSLAPTLNFESIIAKDCEEDLSLINEFIEYFDNCAVKSIEFKDSLLLNTLCISQYNREYRIEDYCNNLRIVQQKIQVEDFSGPKFITGPNDRTVYCGSTNITLDFQSWLTNFADTQINDNCNSFKLFARNQGDLIDSTGIISASEVSLNQISCIDGSSEDIIFKQEVFFYAFDQCGNVNVKSAFYNLIDTLAPVIPTCPRDLDIILEYDECDRFTTINPPFVVDPCLSIEDVRWTINIDEDFIFENTKESIDFNFDIGSHHISYSIRDCSGNSSFCEQIINVLDTFPPFIECPEDINIYLLPNSCESIVHVPEIKSFTDNCFGIANFNSTLPKGGAFIQFEFNETDSSYSGSSFTIEFNDIINDQRFFKPVITIEYALNIDIQSRLVLKSELSEELFIAEKAPCVRQKKKLIISENQFSVWSLDKDIKFAVSVEKLGGKGLLPCKPENLDGPFDIDEFSFFSVSLQFTEVNPDFTITNEFGEILFENQATISLESGEFELNYQAEDFAGNKSNCNTQISIIDTIHPSITCQDQELILTPETDEFIDIVLSDLNIIIDDNCSIDNISYFPSDFSCQQIDRTVPIVVQAWDSNDNFSFCTASLFIKGSELEPEFIGGLCLADTLKLFANIDNAIEGDFIWIGPSGYNSNERNPIITNINILNSGVYTLDLKTSKGCNFSGSIDIDISQFLSPKLNTNSLTVCQNELITLNSNSFSEIVIYQWYQGIFPNGDLIEVSDIPTIEISAPLGIQSYYVIVDGEGCKSMPSLPLQVEVLEIPASSITESFITVCNGDSISFQAANEIQGFNYKWTGPDNYISSSANSDVILNATSDNEGLYSLVVNNQNCFSTASMVQVFVTEPPDKPIVQIQSAYCEGDEALLSVGNISSVGNVFHWYLNNILYTSLNTNNLIISNITEDLRGLWTVVVEGGLCNSDISDIIQLNIESIPNIGASNDGPVCQGDSIQLTASFIPNATYEWIDPNGNRFFTRELKPLAKDGSYSVTVTSSNGCQNSTSTIVSVGLRPQITALSNSAINCMPNNGSFSLNPTVFPPGNYIYNWTGPNNFSSGESNPIIENITQDDTGIYELTVIEEECASQIANTIVDFTIIPEAAVVAGDTTVCENSTLVLEVLNPIVHNSSKWIWISPQGQLSTDEPILVINNFNNTLQGNYSVFQEINDCRSPVSNSINVQSIMQMGQASISGPTQICEGENLELSASGLQGSSYFWIIPNGDTINQNSSTLTINSITQIFNGDYQVFTKQGNCTSELSQAFNIEVTAKPNTAQFQIDSTLICRDFENNIEICINSNNENFDKIQILDLEEMSIVHESIDTCFVIDLSNYLNRNSIDLIIQIIKDECPSDFSLPLNIKIQSKPDDYLQVLDDRIYVCGEYSIDIQTDVLVDNINPLWASSDSEIIIFDQDQLLVQVNNLRHGTNEIILNSLSEGCGIYARDTVNVIVLDIIEAIDDQIEIEYGNTIQLDILANDNFSGQLVITSSNSNLLGEYRIINNKIVYENEDLIGEFNLEYEICYTECPTICSIAKINLRISDSQNCLVGNIITANNDGINDEFRITCLEQNAFPNNKLVVFNQWGDEVFRASPYLNDWKATYKNEYLTSGTYFYWLDLGDDSRILNGFIVVE